jgi:protein gp37
VADTNIEWATKVWNPTRGCSRVSPGCGTGREGGCYAERQAIRHAGPGGAYEGLVRIGKHGPSWTGKVVLVEEKLWDPVGWKKPERIFVNSMSDLFHEALRLDDIERVWNVMATVERHQYLVLTKRAENMRDFVCDWYRRSQAKIIPQIWLGVSVEDQATADERIPLLLQTPAAVRFVSYEPALGPVDLRRWLTTREPITRFEAFTPEAKAAYPEAPAALIRGGIDWCIVGGESGPRARPFDLEWARSTIRQCRGSGVACFVKQLGASPYGDPEPTGNFRSHEGRRQFEMRANRVRLADRKGGDMEEWPEALRVREFPTTRTP